MVGTLGTQTLRLAEAGHIRWLKEAKSTAGSVQGARASEFAATSRGLILRTVTWTTLGSIATALEAWQINKDIDRATSAEEKWLLKFKLGVVSTMSLVAAAQGIGVVLGHWFTFAWVMSTPVVILLAFLGLLYLTVSMIANRYKREGLRLWLYRCSWGRAADPAWLETKEQKGHVRQMMALQELLQRPTVLGRALYSGGGSTPRRCHGFWVQVQLPSILAGKVLTMRAAMVDSRLFSSSQLHAVPTGFYSRFLDGNWVDPKQLGKLPADLANQADMVDFGYTGAEPYWLWQVWIPTSIADPLLELEVRYPAGVLQREDGRSYFFRVAMGMSVSDADLLGDAFSGELKEEEEVLLASQPVTLLELALPGGQRKVRAHLCLSGSTLKLPEQLHWTWAHEPELLGWTIRARNYNTFVANGMFIFMMLVALAWVFFLYSAYKDSSPFWRVMSCLIFFAFGMGIVSCMTHQKIKCAYRFTSSGVEHCEWKDFPEWMLTALKWFAVATGLLCLWMVTIDPGYLLGALVGPGSMGLSYLALANSRQFREMNTSFHHYAYEWHEFTQLAIATNREVVDLKYIVVMAGNDYETKGNFNIFCKRKQKESIAAFIHAHLSPDVPFIRARVDVPMSTD